MDRQIVFEFYEKRANLKSLLHRIILIIIK